MRILFACLNPFLSFWLPCFASMIFDWFKYICRSSAMIRRIIEQPHLSFTQWYTLYSSMINEHVLSSFLYYVRLSQSPHHWFLAKLSTDDVSPRWQQHVVRCLLSRSTRCCRLGLSPSVCIWMHENVDMWRSLAPQILWPSPRTRWNRWKLHWTPENTP